MSRIHKWRLLYVSVTLGITAIIVYLVLFALRQNINLFFTPTELLQQRPLAQVRVGGEVKANSLVFREKLQMHFVLTDYEQDIVVHYQGILPDLFREEQAIVAKGKLLDDVFYADQILAKHDQNYTPPELLAKRQN